MKFFIVLVSASLISCTFMPSTQLTDTERLLTVCEAWLPVFDRINTRDEQSLATDREIDAVDKAIEVINPHCKTELGTTVFDINKLERALIETINAERGL